MNPLSRDPRLIVAIHDVSPRFAREIDALRDLLARHVAPDTAAMLVVPNYWGSAPLVPGSAFARQLREWAATGTEMFAHGWFHRDWRQHRRWAARLKAQHLTAGEGEFLGLSEYESGRRMDDARDLIEEIIETPVAGFVAPAWLYGEGAIAALARSGFDLAEDHWRVWRPATGDTLARSPVITWASRSPARIASSLAAAPLLEFTLRFAPVVRVAVHPGDVRVPALVESIHRTLDALLRYRRPTRYRDLLPIERMRCAS